MEINFNARFDQMDANIAHLQHDVHYLYEQQDYSCSYVSPPPPHQDFFFSFLYIFFWKLMFGFFSIYFRFMSEYFVKFFNLALVLFSIFSVYFPFLSYVCVNFPLMKLYLPLSYLLSITCLSFLFDFWQRGRNIWVKVYLFHFN